MCIEVKNESFKKIDVYLDLYTEQIFARRIPLNFPWNFRQEIDQERGLIFQAIAIDQSPSPTFGQKIEMNISV